MIKLKCTCGKLLKVKPEYAGKRLKCPDCQAPVTVPNADDASPLPQKSATGPAAKPEKKKKPSRQLSANDFGDDETDNSEFNGADDYGMHDAPVALPPRRKKNATASASGTTDKPVADAASAMSPKLLYSMYALAGTVSAVVVFFVVWMIIRAGSASSPDAAALAMPEKFVVFKHGEAGLSVECPDGAGWITDSGGGTGGVPPWITVKNEKQEVFISIRGSVSGTAISDIASGGVAPGALDEDLPDELHPAAVVHKFQHDKIRADYNTYEETEPRKIETGFGEGRVSDFTAGSAFSTEYGLRATLIANQYQYNVICKVPKKRLAAYRPILERMIKSVGG